MAFTERPADAGIGEGPALESTATAHMAFVDTLCSDGYAHTLNHAIVLKWKFDKKVRVLDFQPGDIVQVYDKKLEKSFSVHNKLAPRWLGPLRIITRHLNSYSVNSLGETEGGIHVHG
ncbi:hypothetical protein K439DRAFT_1342849 [Ramaria rubella]|nr:hypothetical protein K439DRAFT_1342849 [Ramaria rubella]